MGAVVGAMFAVGALLVWVTLRPSHRGVAVDRPQSRPQPHGRVATQSLRRALGFGVGFALIAFLLTQLPAMAVIGFVAGAGLPRSVASRRAARDAALRAAAWPELIDGLISAVRAGMSLPEAICAAGDRGPVVLRRHFEGFAADYRATGRLDECLASLRSQLADPVADRIVEVLLVARDVGGQDLGQVLGMLATFLRQDLRLRNEVAARRSWTVNGAKLAVAAPWAVLLLLSTRPANLDSYRSSGGAVVLITAAIVSALAYWLMVRIGRLPYEHQVAL